MNVLVINESPRRSGLSDAFDELNKYFAIAGMPMAFSQYGNSIHGSDPGKRRRMKKDCRPCVL